jgi:hypothetical protein
VANVKRVLTVVIVYALGIVSGLVYQHTTSGARERARTAAVESEMKAKNDKLEKCTDILIDNYHVTTTGQASPKIARTQ